MNGRAPRNRTLVVDDDERAVLMNQALSLHDPCTVEALENKVVHQDLLSCVDFLPDRFVDLALIDPPYNLTKAFAGTKFVRTSSDAYERWLESWIGRLKRCFKESASLYVFSDWRSSSAVQTVLNRHFIVRNRITWEREKGRGAAKNWKNCSEDIWFCTVSDDYYFNVDAVKLKRKVVAPYRDPSGEPKDWQETPTGNYRLTHPSNLWTDISVPFWSMPENTDHPTQKPEKLVAKLVLASSKPGDFILEPFSGSGTGCVVAKKLHRRFAGVEIEAEYCQMALKRLARVALDDSIQGYHDGVFWERNSLTSPNGVNRKGKGSNAAAGLFDA